MSLWSRFANVFRADRVNREIDEELRSHIDEAIEHGRAPAEADRAFGSMLRRREDSRDIRLAPWLDSLRADVVFSWRLLIKHKTATATAILSLALATGACTSAFRLIDALLLRPLPVADSDRLYFVTYPYVDRAGNRRTADSFDYPTFLDLRASITDAAELMAISDSDQRDLSFASDQEMEKGYRQFVSGWMFRSFGLNPALGRLLTHDDDLTPGAHPVAVLSHEYWTRRFGQDPDLIGRTLRMRNGNLTLLYEIVGVSEEGFTGTETGAPTDIFLPTMMMDPEAISEPHWNWFRVWAHLRPGVSPEQVRDRLQPVFSAARVERSKDWDRPREQIDDYVNTPIELEPAAAGVSQLQRDYHQALAIFAIVVLLVLLIACANVTNLITAQAAARARELALRVAIGAGRRRLVQLAAVECALIAAAASVLGGMFAWRAAPFVASMINPSGDPVRLFLVTDWRAIGFVAALTLIVTALLGLAPALRASMVRPVSALKGGVNPHARSRLMRILVAAQVAFCVLVYFASGLFLKTFDRLSNQPTGFVSERLLILDTVAGSDQPLSRWNQLMVRLSSAPGVESAARSSWALMSGSGWTTNIWVNGEQRKSPYFLAVSPGWIDTMKIQLIGGRDLRDDDAYPSAALVNEAFAKQHFDGQNPVGRSFENRMTRTLGLASFQIVGYVRDARYRGMREPIQPTVYVPLRANDPKILDSFQSGRARATFVVRTLTDNPLTLAAALRQEVASTGFGFRLSNVRTQTELVRQHTTRERLLATLSVFFGAVALLLSGIGLYGVLNYAVDQRRREIGLRMALGAQASRIARGVAAEIVGMLALGVLAGLAAGVVSGRYVEALLYDVNPSDVPMLILPALVMLSAATLAALPPIVRAVRINPALMLRAE